MRSKAIVFAGQGAQAVGMGKDLAEAYPECRALFEQADSVLGFSLSKLCFEGPVEALTKSNNCQPAIFVTSIACYRALCREVDGLSFAGTAGLSLGEWSALHVAGVLGFADTLRVLEARGRFMQEACEEREGGMVSVLGLTVDKVKGVAAAAGVEVANMNSAEQIVLSGERSRMGETEKLAKEAGASRTVVLNVAGAFHSSLMASAAKKLEAFLARITLATPTMPVVANVMGAPHGGPDEIRRAMVKQVTSSVQWVSSVEWFKAHGVSEYVECGPGKVLSGLIKRIDKDAVLSNIQDCATLKKAVETIQS